MTRDIHTVLAQERRRNVRHRAAVTAGGGRMLTVRLDAQDCARLAALRERHGCRTDRDTVAFALRLATEPITT